MTKARDRAVEGRSDLSRFVVHLTRNDTKDDPEYGQTAKENFKGIARDRKILALRPHCLHRKKIPKEHWPQFSVCCFTEVPLTELHLLTRQIEQRQNQYSDYGFVFTREFLISKGGQPAVYVSSYGDNKRMRKAADSIFDIAQKEGLSQGKLRHLLPFLNAMHGKYDFAWEREWRVVGDLEFKPKDVVCVILPEKGAEKLTQAFLKYGVPVISPGWTAERVVAEFSRQARSVHRWGSKIEGTKKGRKRAQWRRQRC